MLFVNLPKDWVKFIIYILNNNEIDGITNKKIKCTKDKFYS